jgi:hypothetical protein
MKISLVCTQLWLGRVIPCTSMQTSDFTYKFFSFVGSYFKIALDIWLVPYPLGCLTLHGFTEYKINK